MATVSPPHIPVRHNRTEKLRRIFAVTNDDLSYLMKPPQSEGSPTVIGQNKSVSKTTEKQVTRWYKEQFYVMERMNKSQSDTYDSFLRIEREKTELIKPSKQLEEEARKALPTRNGVIKTAAIRHANKLTKSADHIADIFDDREKTDNAIQTQAQDILKSAKSIELPVIHTDRPVRHTAPSRGANGDETDNRDSPVSRHSFLLSKVPRGWQNGQNEQNEQNCESEKHSKRGSMEKSEEHTKHHQQTRITLDMTVVPWLRTRSGRLERHEYPYKRRSFPQPKDPAVRERLTRSLIEQENRKREMHVRQYGRLCDNITELEKWDPLEEIRARMPKEEEEKVIKNDYKNMGAMSVWMKAFHYNDDYIKSLDPNSEEALEMCKYLRRKGEPIPNELAASELQLMDDEKKTDENNNDIVAEKKVKLPPEQQKKKAKKIKTKNKRMSLYTDEVLKQVQNIKERVPAQSKGNKTNAERKKSRSECEREVVRKVDDSLEKMNEKNE